MLEGDDKLHMIKDMRLGTPRAQRAHRFANLVLSMMRDFVPRNGECHRSMMEYLLEVAYESNLEIINVPPEWDALDKLAIESAMWDRKVEVIEGAQAIAGATSLVRDVCRT